MPICLANITARIVAFIGDENAGLRSRLPLAGKERAMPSGRRFIQFLTLTERLDQEAARLRGEAKTLPQGLEPERVLQRARQAENATHVDEWLSSPGLRSPR
jgi:hypothetical protein